MIFAFHFAAQVIRAKAILFDSSRSGFSRALCWPAGQNAMARQEGRHESARCCLLDGRKKTVKRPRRNSIRPRPCSPVLLAAILALYPGRSLAEVRSVSRVYHAACLERGQSYWDYENFQLSSLSWDAVDSHEVTGRLGFGRFSEVLEGVTVKDGHKVVLKVLKPARTYKIKREIRVLQLLSGGPNVLRLEGACRDRNTGTTTLVLEHLGDGVQWFGHTTIPEPPRSAGRTAEGAGPGAGGSSRTPPGAQAGSGMVSGTVASSINSGRAMPSPATPGKGTVEEVSQSRAWRHNVRVVGVPDDGRRSGQGSGLSDGERSSWVDPGRLTDYEVRLFLYKLLQALDFAHSRGLMHRDVKPRNVIINRQTRCLRLIDWGLGDFYIPGRRNMARVGSRYYKAPELLVGYRFYDYAVDVFSVGCILAGFLLNREPFFRGKDNEDQLVRIALVLGTQGLHDFLRKYDVALEPRLMGMLGTHRKKAWESIGGGSEGKTVCSPDGLDLLDRMLCYDHQDRISAGEALSHVFFDPVRAEAEAEYRKFAND